jgi:thiamine pyrophosphate-dependent acetolactate synthase large subunit-like protein
MVAEAIGVPGLVARTAAAAGLALDQAIAHQGPALVEVIMAGLSR